MFLATYGDGLTDAPLPEVIDAFRRRDKLAMFLSVKPQFNAHLVLRTGRHRHRRRASQCFRRADQRRLLRVKREILDWIQPGDELVEETFARLIPSGEVVAYRYEGFFRPMDTIKDRQSLEALHETGSAPWRQAGSPQVVSGAG